MAQLKAPERFETERLVLRRPTAADAQEIYRRYASDREVTRYLSWPCHTAVDATSAFIQFSDAQWRDSAAGPYLIESRSGLLLGGTGLELESAARATTGYVLARDAWGLGYATEVLRAIIDLARQLRVRQLQASCHIENTASQRVLEKCGFERKQPMVVRFPNLQPGEPGDAWLYELVVAFSGSWQTLDPNRR